MLSEARAYGRRRTRSSGRRSSGETRRLALLKRMGLFSECAAEITRAVSEDELLGAYRLVYDVFREEGYIPPCGSKLRMRVFEALPETATFVAKFGQNVVGVQSLVPDSNDLGLPSDGAFAEEINALRDKGRQVCEATNESVARDYRNTAVATELMRCCFAHAAMISCQDLITAVTPGHARFYSLLGFEEIGPERSYSREVEDPVVLVRMDFDSIGPRAAIAELGQPGDDAFLKRYYLDENPYRHRVSEWAQDAESLWHDANMLRDMFVRRENLLGRCRRPELEALRKRWGGELLAQVIGEKTNVYA